MIKGSRNRTGRRWRSIRGTLLMYQSLNERWQGCRLISWLSCWRPLNIKQPSNIDPLVLADKHEKSQHVLGRLSKKNAPNLWIWKWLALHISKQHFKRTRKDFLVIAQTFRPLVGSDISCQPSMKVTQMIVLAQSINLCISLFLFIVFVFLCPSLCLCPWWRLLRCCLLHLIIVQSRSHEKKYFDESESSTTISPFLSFFGFTNS